MLLKEVIIQDHLQIDVTMNSHSQLIYPYLTNMVKNVFSYEIFARVILLQDLIKGRGAYNELVNVRFRGESFALFYAHMVESHFTDFEVSRKGFIQKLCIYESTEIFADCKMI